jgi:hypothetical protein
VNKSLLILAILALSGPLIAESLTPKARASLDLAVALSRQAMQFAPPGRLKPKEIDDFLNRPLQFADAIATFGSELNSDAIRESSSEKTIEQKIVAIAADRKQEAERYAEIQRVYNDRLAALLPYKQENASPIVILPPDVKPEHTAAEYRLPWEYALLKPGSTNFMHRFEDRAFTALVTIKDERSLTTFAYLWESLRTAPALDPETLERRTTPILSCMVTFPGERGLISILRSLEIASRETDRLKSPVEASLKNILVFSGRKGNQEQWQSAIEAFTSKTNTLSQSQKTIFEAFATRL